MPSDRLVAAIDGAHALVEKATREHSPAARLICFSGGNDSTVLLHMLRGVADAVVHINTTIGIEQTREFVRSTVAGMGLPLVEQRPEMTFEEIVMRWGFPGPAGHRLVYNRLKERPLRKVRSMYQTRRGERVLFITGIRRHESARRFYSGYEPINRIDAMVFVNALFDFDADLMREYREEFDVPRNPVSDLIHMSGECLCGAFAHPGEREELRLWFPEVVDRIEDLEHRARHAGVPACVWGERPPRKGELEAFVGGELCSACDLKAEEYVYGEGSDA